MSSEAEKHFDDKRKAMERLEGMIAAINEKLGDDSDWKRIKKLIERLSKHFHYEWEYLPLLPYKEYLQTNHWKRTRARAMEKAEKRCQTCNASDVELHTHHRSYDRLGIEKDADLIVLCKRCHGLFHELRELSD